MGVRELVSTLIAAAMPKGTSTLVKNLMDIGADTFVDSAEQIYNIWKNGGSLSDFDHKRLWQTAATSAVNNMLFTCDPVNCVRGNLFCFREDLESRDLYGSFTFQRRYDSVLQFKGTMGQGWMHEYETMFQMENRDTIMVLMPDSSE